MQTETRPRQVKVVGHRGGFRPDNTLHAFGQAKKHQLFGVELDVWITKDHQLAVIHGGKNGELPKRDESEQEKLIFEMTLEEARDYFRQTPVYADSLKVLEEAGLCDKSLIDIPTLDQVFDLIDTNMEINIEVKTPKFEEFKPQFASMV